MATTAAEILVRVSADTAALTSGLQKAEAQTKSFGQRMDSLGKSMTRIGSRMTVGLTLPIVGFGAKAVSAFEESEQAARQTAAVLKSTGGVANVTAKQIDSLAQSLSDKAAVDDEVIQQGANMLLTFTNIRNEAGAGNDMFNQSVNVLADVAAAMAAASGGEMDVKSTAIQLGKALNDPIKGMTALTRVGVSFTEEQKAQVTALVQSGQTMEAQKVILAELTKEFGGSAKAQATDSARMKVAFDQLAESVGSMLAPIMAKLAQWMQTVTSAFQGLSPETQRLVVGVLAIVAALGPALVIFGKLLQMVKLVQAAFLVLSANPVMLILAAIAAIALLIIANWDKVKVAMGAIADWVTAKWQAVVSFFSGIPGRIGAAFAAVRDGIMNAFRAAINFVISAWNRLDFGINVKIPSWIPFVGGKSFGISDLFPDIPMLADGGIVTRPTLAMIGERGPEAVVPLGAGGMGSALTVNVVLDRKTFARQQDYYSRASGL